MYGIKFYLFFGEEALQIKMIKLLKTKKRKKQIWEAGAGKIYDNSQVH